MKLEHEQFILENISRQKYDQAVEYYEKALKLGFEDLKFLEKITPYL